MICCSCAAAAEVESLNGTPTPTPTPGQQYQQHKNQPQQQQAAKGGGAVAVAIAATAQLAKELEPQSAQSTKVQDQCCQSFGANCIKKAEFYGVAIGKKPNRALFLIFCRN